MRRAISSFFVLALCLLPLLADPGKDCLKHPENPGCKIGMTENWGMFETIVWFVVVPVVFWLFSRLRARRLKKS